MTSATGNRRWDGQHAFSVLEIMIVLILIVLLTGLFTGLTVEFHRQEQLPESARELERMARLTSRTAAARREAIPIEFTIGGFQSPALSRESERSFSIPEEVSIQLRRWDSREWVSPEEQVWIFSETGMCEPVSVRLEQGRYWIELDFNPLTGTVEEERFLLP